MAAQERLRAVRCVRQYVVHNKVGETEEHEESEWHTPKISYYIQLATMPTATAATIESASQLYKTSHADLVKGCQHANRELQQHKVYLDQLLTIVIDKHPEILSMVTEAQKMRSVASYNIIHTYIACMSTINILRIILYTSYYGLQRLGGQ